MGEKKMAPMSSEQRPKRQSNQYHRHLKQYFDSKPETVPYRNVKSSDPGPEVSQYTQKTRHFSDAM